VKSLKKWGLKFKRRVKKSTLAAVEMSRKFYGFDPRNIKNLNIVWPKSLVCLGACAQVDYVTDKYDGVVRQYFHEFDGPCVLLASPKPQKNGQNMLVIVGKFDVNEKGIIG